MNYEDVLMAKIAWYYYIENMTQQKISDMLGISRMRVIKLLEKAHQSGIIQFKIREDSLERIHIEKQLIEHFNLKDAFVVPTHPNEDEINESIAKAAAMYINDRLTKDCFINIGYGDTLSKLLNNLSIISNYSLSYVSLTGGVNHYLANARPEVFNNNLYLTPAPLMASTKEMVAAMQGEASIKEISRLTKLSSMTVLSVGELDKASTISKLNIINQNDLLFLAMRGVVGDILCHFIDKDGNLVDTPIEERLISTPLNILKELDNVIGVAAGLKKVEAIRAALKGEYLDVLITDESTATELLNNLQ